MASEPTRSSSPTRGSAMCDKETESTATPQEYVVDLTGISQAKLDAALNTVLVHSAPLTGYEKPVKGLDYEKEITLADLVMGYETGAFQATHLGQARNVIEQALKWRLSQEEVDPEDEGLEDEPGIFSWARPDIRERTRARIFLSFTSNMMSSGLREAFVYLAKHRLIDCIATTGGGIEEDFVKCMGVFVVGSFSEVKGSALRAKGWNRTGNIYVPNENYVKFEEWLQPILDKCLEEQKEHNIVWTPSKLIKRLGKEINDESSLYYWCYKNDIPVFCPALTDGSLGDNIFFHRMQKPGLVVDIVGDIQHINSLAIASKKSAIIVLGGGTPKHHIANANLFRNGTDFAVYISTAHEFDGCDSGASPDEAKSWAKIKAEAPAVKVCVDATIAFPLLAATVFKDEVAARKQEVAKWALKESDHKNTPDGFILTSPWKMD